MGLGMVAGGVYGIATGDDDDDDSSTTTTTTPLIPGATPSVPGAPDPCAEASDRDFRLQRIDSFSVEPVGRETGIVEIRVSCAAQTIFLSFRLEDLQSRKTASYPVWLYKSRRKAKQIGSLLGTDDRTGIGSATILPDVDTSKYDEIVITRTKFGSGESRPGRIVFRGSL